MLLVLCHQDVKSCGAHLADRIGDGGVHPCCALPVEDCPFHGNHWLDIRGVIDTKKKDGWEQPSQNTEQVHLVGSAYDPASLIQMIVSDDIYPIQQHLWRLQHIHCWSTFWSFWSSMWTYVFLPTPQNIDPMMKAVMKVKK
jgi:hypothetical protein